MNPFEAGFREGTNTSKPLLSETAATDYLEGFLKGRIKAAREYEQSPVGCYPLPCRPLEVEVVLEHSSPCDALRMILPETFRSPKL
jgi:hypothetical protein